MGRSLGTDVFQTLNANSGSGGKPHLEANLIFRRGNEEQFFNRE
jgi:hypothetical protein